MATHKVPQDVEAEDKLIGFLSLKQFILTVLGLGFGYLAFVFFKTIHPIAALIWIPPAGICFVLGLYQRKDQPVEVYLASALRFYLKPHKRKWSLEGYEERVVITAPPKIEHNYTKNFTGEEATSRLNNLSRLMDSRGWATKLASDIQNPQLATAAASDDRLMQPSDIYSQSVGINPQNFQQPADMMAQTSAVAQDFQTRINQTETTTKQHAIQAIQSARQAAAADDDNISDSRAETVPEFQKYPTMHQKIVSPTPIQPQTELTVKPAEVPAEALKPVAHVLASPVANQPKEQVSDDGSVEIRLH